MHPPIHVLYRFIKLDVWLILYALGLYHLLFRYELFLPSVVVGTHGPLRIYFGFKKIRFGLLLEWLD